MQQHMQHAGDATVSLGCTIQYSCVSTAGHSGERHSTACATATVTATAARQPTCCWIGRQVIRWTLNLLGKAAAGAHLSGSLALLLLGLLSQQDLLPLPCHLLEELLFERPLRGDSRVLWCFGLFTRRSSLAFLAALLLVMFADFLDDLQECAWQQLVCDQRIRAQLKTLVGTRRSHISCRSIETARNAVFDAACTLAEGLSRRCCPGGGAALAASLRTLYFCLRLNLLLLLFLLRLGMLLCYPHREGATAPPKGGRT